jgi:ABC-2 type transport system permease protein
MTESMLRTLAIARKELRHIRRDRITGVMIFGIPLVMTLLFGYAINHDVRHLPAAVVDDAGTSTSRRLLADAQATRLIDIRLHCNGVDALRRALDAGDVLVGIVIPPDFERRLVDRDRPVAQLLIDGSDPVVQGVAKSLSQLPVAGIDRGAIEIKKGAPVAALETRVLYNPERRSPVFIVPGICGVILNLTMVLFTAVAIVRERERGNLELLITTPIRGIELMIGKILPYIAIGYVQASIIMLLGVWLFDVPIHGAMLDFALAVGLFIISILTLGLLISTLASSQFQAFQMTFMSFLPQMLLSGFMFPFEGMPRPAQWLAELFPLTHFLRLVRGIVLRDASIVMLRGEIWPLATFFAVFLMLSTIWFNKRLD